ncbi:hypothetical protein AK51_27095 [Serratia nematodiphila DZ0503SBS1]|nr:hypothetical protein AK51_27095 [Serratia nematodiphila DZ0503SBS1]
MTIAESGEGKTTINKQVMKPCYAFASSLIEQYEQHIADYKHQFKLWKFVSRLWKVISGKRYGKATLVRMKSRQ